MKMKITSVVLAFAVSALFMSTNAKAQGFDKGTNAINLGVGIGGAYGYASAFSGGSGFSQTPSLSISYEHGIWPNIGPGTISLGGFFGYKHMSWTDTFQDWNNGNGNGYQTYTEKDSWTYYIIGLRAAYHLKTKNDKFDPYAGLMLGYYNVAYSYSNNDPSYNTPGHYAYTSISYPGYIGISVFVGARYCFTNNFGVFGELGYGYSILNLGLTYKW